MKNLAYRLIGDLMLIAQSDKRAPDEEANPMMDAIVESGLSSVRTLVISEGGSPSPTQRKRMEDVMRGRDMTIALVSDKTGARLAAHAIGLFSPKIKAFTSRQLDEALAHLKVPPGQRREVMDIVAALQEELDRG